MKWTLACGILLTVCVGVLVFVKQNHSTTSDLAGTNTVWLPTKIVPCIISQPASNIHDTNIADLPDQKAKVGDSVMARTAVSQIPERFQWFVEKKCEYPPAEVIGKLGTNDEDLLAELYLRETELTNRRALTWAMTAVGREKSAEIFIATISTDFEMRTFTLQDWAVMRDTVFGLGFLAQFSGKAYVFLDKATTIGYWQANRTWKEANAGEESYADVRFASLAIQAMGASLDVRLPVQLAQWKQTADQLHPDMRGSIAEAAFYYDIGTERGRQELLQIYLNGRTFREYTKWRKSEKGQPWRLWLEEGKQKRRQ
jgi:hypothetical protein